MIKLMYNETEILICEQHVLSRLNTKYHHIIIMHMDNRYKWKPVRDKTTSYYCCDAKESSNSLSPLIFYRLQPTGGSYLNFCKLQLARKLQIPSIFYELQPIGGSYLNFWKIQLARKLQLPNIFCMLQPIGGSYLTQLQLEIYQDTTWKETTIPSLNMKVQCWFTWISTLFSSCCTKNCHLDILLTVWTH